MDFLSPSPSFFNPDACAKFLDSFLNPFEDSFGDPFLFENPWNDNEQGLNLDADRSLDIESGEMDTQVIDAEGEASQVSTQEVLPAESTSPLPDASSKEKAGAYVVEDDKAAGHDAHQDTNSTSGEEAPKDTLAEDDKAAGQDADQHIHLTMSEVQEVASFVADQEFHPMVNEETVETVKAGVEKMAGVQATEAETDCGQSAHQNQAASVENSDIGPAVQNGETVQEHESAMEETSEQSAAQGDPLAQKDDVLQEVPDVEMSGMPELGAEATANNSTDQDHGAALPKDTDGDRTAVEAVFRDPDQGGAEQCTIGTQEKPEASNGETSDNAARSRGEVEVEDGINGNAGNAREDSLGSKDNPIPLDDEEELPSQSSNEPIVIEDDDEKPPSQPSRHSTKPLTQSSFGPVRPNKRKRNSAINDDKEREPSTQASGGPVRRNQGKRNFEGMSLWADTKFLEKTASDLNSAWETAQISWIKMESLTEQVAGADDELGAAVTHFKKKMRIMCEELDNEDELSLESAFEIENCWREVGKRLQEMKHLDGTEKDAVQEFDRTLGQLAGQAELYDCIQEYPNSIDRKDEDYDGDFKARSCFKIPRR